ncbi:MAG: phage tail tube protein [bacterium]
MPVATQNLGQYAAWGIGKETTPGTAVAPTVFYKVNNFKATCAEDKITPDTVGSATTSSGRALAMVLPGKKAYSFDVASMIWIPGLGNILKAALGSVTTSGSADPYTHTFTGESTGLLPSYTMESKVNDIVYRMAGCHLNSLEIACVSGGVATWNTNWRAITEATATAATANFPTDLPLTWDMFSFKVDETDNVDIEGFRVRIENNLEVWYAVTNNPQRPLAQARRVTGEITLGYTSNTWLTKMSSNTPFALEILATYSANRTLKITIPKAYIMTDPRPEIRPGRLVSTIPFTAAYDATAENDISIELKNGDASY